MTEEDLAAIENSMKQISPGPWFPKPLPKGTGFSGSPADFAKVVETATHEIVCYAYEIADPSRVRANTEFIASSWQNTKKLLEEVRRLRELLGDRLTE